jgi:dipeptidyl aminopeptidase/acylaminoacyl peptidase
MSGQPGPWISDPFPYPTRAGRRPCSVLRSVWVLPIAALAAVSSVQAQAVDSLDLNIVTMNQNVSTSVVLASPDGEELLVVSNRSGDSKLWIMSADGGEARMLVAGRGSESQPAWASDGGLIAFVRSVEGRPGLWVVGRDGGGVRMVAAQEGSMRGLTWAPDGSRIAFISDADGHQDIWVADVGSGAVRRVTDGANPWDEVRWAPTWSSDSRRIAYVSNRSDPMSDDLWVVDVDSRQTEKLTASIHVMSNPIWSPDGRWIAFNGMAHHEFWYGDQSDIYLVSMPDRKVRKLESNTYASDGNGGVQMQWGPDSGELFFRFEWQGDSNLWRIPVDGGVATQITYEEGGFRNFSIAGDGSLAAYIRQTPLRGGEVHVVPLEGGAVRQVTQWVRPYRNLRKPEKITFRARDGHRILGYLSLPPDFDPSRRYPALVQAHGGGNNAHGNGFHVLEHLLASEGFVVLAIEYRGSSGHGREFQDLALNAWASEQGWDGVAAAEFLRSRPYTLDGGVGMYGGSYGGIMTMAAVTRDASPFAAAAPLYGIFDWETAYEFGDRLMQFWIIEGHEGFKPGEDPERFRRNATIRNLDGVPSDLPFLVIHGELDRRAPFQQSVALRDALLQRGNPVEFHSYPNEYHGFRHPANREHAYGRMIEFFKSHVGTPTGRDE